MAGDKSGSTAQSNYAVDLVVQLLALAGGAGVIIAASIQLHTSTDFYAEWCERDDVRMYELCWTRNFNAGTAFSFYSLALIGLGAFAVIAELRIREFSRPPGFLALPGIMALGAARNTGILCGSFGIAVGAVQLLVYYLTKSEHGPLCIGGRGAAPSLVDLVRHTACLAALGVIIAGLMTIIGLAEATNDVDLRWRDPDESDNWKRGSSPAYAIGCYGVMLLVLGVALVAANLKFGETLRPFFPWHILGALMMGIGVLTLGATGNTGILLGAFTVIVGFVMWILAVLYAVADGYAYKKPTSQV